MAEPEVRPEGGEVTDSKLWLGDKKVRSYKESGETTPAGLPILEITTDDGVVKLTEAKFNAIKGYKKCDLTELRNRIVKVVGQKVYALIMEYGPTLPEVDHILNEAVRLANDATEQANNVLWGVEASHERSLLDVNNILSKEYGEQKGKEKDASSSERGGVDTTNKG